jgi:mannose-6-phosphate isomerase-like protein (cupin superfamily)
MALHMPIEFLGKVEGDLLGKDHGGISATVIHFEGGPGEGPKLHRHTYPELFFVIEGEATFTDGESERVVREGETVIADAGQWHGFTNSGTGVLRQIDVHLSAEFVTEWRSP